eukprot:GHVS01101655.1.p1 GENE.GHVS01101655.1~~GHVS01101655.1.p1  ORF type:complete len:984 (+),score=97.01 GHVS01101655.1:156-3107(+)
MCCVLCGVTPGYLNWLPFVHMKAWCSRGSIAWSIVLACCLVLAWLTPPPVEGLIFTAKILKKFHERNFEEQFVNLMSETDTGEVTPFSIEGEQGTVVPTVGMMWHLEQDLNHYWRTGKIPEGHEANKDIWPSLERFIPHGAEKIQFKPLDVGTFLFTGVGVYRMVRIGTDESQKDVVSLFVRTGMEVEGEGNVEWEDVNAVNTRMYIEVLRPERQRLHYILKCSIQSVVKQHVFGFKTFDYKDGRQRDGYELVYRHLHFFLTNTTSNAELLTVVGLLETGEGDYSTKSVVWAWLSTEKTQVGLRYGSRDPLLFKDLSQHNIRGPLNEVYPPVIEECFRPRLKLREAVENLVKAKSSVVKSASSPGPSQLDCGGNVVKAKSSVVKSASSPGPSQLKFVTFLGVKSVDVKRIQSTVDQVLQWLQDKTFYGNKAHDVNKAQDAIMREVSTEYKVLGGIETGEKGVEEQLKAHNLLWISEIWADLIKKRHQILREVLSSFISEARQYAQKSNFIEEYDVGKLVQAFTVGNTSEVTTVFDDVTKIAPTVKKAKEFKSELEKRGKTEITVSYAEEFAKKWNAIFQQNNGSELFDNNLLVAQVQETIGNKKLQGRVLLAFVNSHLKKKDLNENELKLFQRSWRVDPLMTRYHVAHNILVHIGKAKALTITKDVLELRIPPVEGHLADCFKNETEDASTMYSEAVAAGFLKEVMATFNLKEDGAKPLAGHVTNQKLLSGLADASIQLRNKKLDEWKEDPASFVSIFQKLDKKIDLSKEDSFQQEICAIGLNAWIGGVEQSDVENSGDSLTHPSGIPKQDPRDFLRQLHTYAAQFLKGDEIHNAFEDKTDRFTTALSDQCKKLIDELKEYTVLVGIAEWTCDKVNNATTTDERKGKCLKEMYVHEFVGNSNIDGSLVAKIIKKSQKEKPKFDKDLKKYVWQNLVSVLKSTALESAGLPENSPLRDDKTHFSTRWRDIRWHIAINHQAKGFQP